MIDVQSEDSPAFLQGVMVNDLSQTSLCDAQGGMIDGLTHLASHSRIFGRRPNHRGCLRRRNGRKPLGNLQISTVPIGYRNGNLSMQERGVGRHWSA